MKKAFLRRYLFLLVILVFVYMGLSCNLTTGFLDSYYVEAPAVTVDKYTTTLTPTWRWNVVKNANDYYVSFNRQDWESTKGYVTYTPNNELSVGKHTLYVMAVNRDEYKSVVGSATTTIIDSAIVIADEYKRPRYYMNNLNIKLLISVNDIADGDSQVGWMRFSENNSDWSGSSWETYSSVKDWTFTNKGNGQYTIYAQFKDASNDVVTQFASVDMELDNVYVNGVVMTGDPTTDGSKEYPFTTITEAINYADSKLSGVYPTIKVGTGTYDEQVTLSDTFRLNGSYDLESWVQYIDNPTYETTIQSSAASTVECKGNNEVEGFTIKSTSSNDNSHTVYITGSYVTIRDNEIYNSNGDNVSSIYADSALSDIIIRDNTIYGDSQSSGSVTAYAINLQNISNSKILSNFIKPAINYSTSFGIYLSATNSVLIGNNIIYADSNMSSTELYGINITDDDNYRIRSNSIVFNGSNSSFNRGILTNTNSNGYINNNILYIKKATSHNYGITYSNISPSVNNNNIYVDGILGDEGNIQGDGTNYNISIDPKFNNLSNGDFHLTANTPYCVTYGGRNGNKEGWDNELDYDFDGHQRQPSDTVTELYWSMGAYEYNGGLSTISIYVNGNTGNDTTATGEQSAPFKTITKAIAKSDMLGRGLAEQWCNILVTSGTYTENVVINKEYIWLYAGYSSDWSSRDTSTYVTTIDASDDGQPAVLVSGVPKRVTLDGFTAQGYNGSSSSFAIKIENCSTEEIVISNSIINGGNTTAAASAYGMYISNSVVTAYNNIINGGSNLGGANTYGVFNSTATSTIKLYNNTIDAGTSLNQVVGLKRSTCFTILANNIIFNSSSAPTKTGIDQTDDANMNFFKSNDIYGFTDTYLVDNISVNPNFKDLSSDDYHLTTSSPAEVRTGGINGSNQSTWPGFTDDIEGITRTADSSDTSKGWSMGAYEQD